MKFLDDRARVCVRLSVFRESMGEWTGGLSVSGAPWTASESVSHLASVSACVKYICTRVT